MSHQQGLPQGIPHHLHTQSLGVSTDIRNETGDVSRTGSGITPGGYQRLLDNHAVLNNQIANLDTTTMAAAAARDAKEIGEKVKVRPFLFPPFGQSISKVCTCELFGVHVIPV